MLRNFERYWSTLYSSVGLAALLFAACGLLLGRTKARLLAMVVCFHLIVHGAVLPNGAGRFVVMGLPFILALAAVGVASASHAVASVLRIRWAILAFAAACCALLAWPAAILRPHSDVDDLNTLLLEVTGTAPLLFCNTAVIAFEYPERLTQWGDPGVVENGAIYISTERESLIGCDGRQRLMAYDLVRIGAEGEVTAYMIYHSLPVRAILDPAMRIHMPPPSGGNWSRSMDRPGLSGQRI